MDITEFLNEFQLEAAEKLDLIASQLLQLERDSSNMQPVREMFLAAHTIKGGAAMLRLTDVQALAHALEDLLSKVRDQQRVVDAPTADLLFQAIDRLRGLISEATPASVGVEPDSALVAFAEQMRSGAPVSVPANRAVRRALVVEPSITVRELHRVLLEEAGYVVEVCSDGPEVVERALGGDYTLVLAGIQGEAMGGLDLSQALSQSGIAVVLTSTDVDQPLTRKATQAGARVLVRKGSLRDSELPRIVRELSV